MSHHHGLMRRSLTTSAIAGAATLATVFASSPALADDPVENPPTSTESTDAEPTSEAPAAPPASGTSDDASPADPAPASTDSGDEEKKEEAPETGEKPSEGDGSGSDGTAPPSGDTSSVSGSTGAPEFISAGLRATDAADVAALEVVPIFGSRKLRIGVQLADGSYAPGTTTLGSVIRILEQDEGGETLRDSDCTTTVVTTGTTTECADTYYSLTGSFITLSQRSAPEGLRRDPTPQIIEPCDPIDFEGEFPFEDEFPFGCDFPFGTEVLFTDTAQKVSRDDDDDADEAAETVKAAPAIAQVNAVLPDTGGSDVTLLGWAALMLAGGGVLTARGRRDARASRR